ncbi:hypothetical protein CEE95_14325 [Lactobacillus crispatus]|nr:hypothetical protein CEE95_14325 [Lactobacillus crispatus]
MAELSTYPECVGTELMMGLAQMLGIIRRQEARSIISIATVAAKMGAASKLRLACDNRPPSPLPAELTASPLRRSFDPPSPLLLGKPFASPGDTTTPRLGFHARSYIILSMTSDG